jgi:hypothetical protein
LKFLLRCSMPVRVAIFSDRIIASWQANLL